MQSETLKHGSNSLSISDKKIGFLDSNAAEIREKFIFEKLKTPQFPDL